jgi:hypothetical protein
MQIRTKRVGRVEGLGQDMLVVTPDGVNPEDEHGQLAISHVAGSKLVMLRTNCQSDSSANLIGIEAVRHVHEALGVVLQKMTVEATLANKQ